MQPNFAFCNIFNQRVREIWSAIRKFLEQAIVAVHTALSAVWSREISVETGLIVCKISICPLFTVRQEIRLAFSCKLATVYERLLTVFKRILTVIYPEQNITEDLI